MTTLSAGPIGLFDSGLGGLTVLRELQRTLPWEQYVYLGDNARFPYGTKGVDTIIRYARECAGFLLRHEVKALIIACNTASAAALSVLEQELSIPVFGTVKPAVRAALTTTAGGSIGVLGTNSTIASNVYEAALREERAGLSIVSQACPLFVPLVEAGMVAGDIVGRIVELYLKPLKEAEVDTIILGCTHYPLLSDAISEYMGHGVQIVECAKAIADEVQTLPIALPPQGSVGESRYFVTDEVGTFNYLATSLLNGRAVSAVRVEHL